MTINYKAKSLWFSLFTLLFKQSLSIICGDGTTKRRALTPTTHTIQTNMSVQTLMIRGGIMQ